MNFMPSYPVDFEFTHHGHDDHLAVDFRPDYSSQVTINEVFEPKSVWVCVTVLSSNQTNQTHVTKRATKQIKLAQSYTNQWMFRGSLFL